jgi:hypothetical protein
VSHFGHFDHFDHFPRRGIGSQSLVTIRYGSRARKIIQGHRESRGT